MMTKTGRYLELYHSAKYTSASMKKQLMMRKTGKHLELTWHRSTIQLSVIQRNLAPHWETDKLHCSRILLCSTRQSWWLMNGHCTSSWRQANTWSLPSLQGTHSIDKLNLHYEQDNRVSEAWLCIACSTHLMDDEWSSLFRTYTFRGTLKYLKLEFALQHTYAVMRLICTRLTLHFERRRGTYWSTRSLTSHHITPMLWWDWFVHIVPNIFTDGEVDSELPEAWLRSKGLALR